MEFVISLIILNLPSNSLFIFTPKPLPNFANPLGPEKLASLKVWLLVHNLSYFFLSGNLTHSCFTRQSFYIYFSRERLFGKTREILLIDWFIQQNLTEHLLTICLSTGYTKVNKTVENPCLSGHYILERGDKQ